MLQLATPAPHSAATGPRGFIQPPIPYAFAFALGNTPPLATRVQPGKVVAIAVMDGTRAPHPPHDLFAGRVPAVPAVTGPVRIDGVCPGDVLEVEVLALESESTGGSGSHIVGIAVANSGVDAVQSAIPAGGVVRVTAHQPGGLVSFGPVVRRRERIGDPPGEPVAARVTVRCTVIQSQGG